MPFCVKGVLFLLISNTALIFQIKGLDCHVDWFSIYGFGMQSDFSDSTKIIHETTLLTFTCSKSKTFSSIFIVDSEQVNVSRV